MTVIGLPQLHAKLARLTAGADVIANQAKDVYAEGIEEAARSKAPVDTGTLRDSIDRTPDSVIATADYAAFVEFGTVNAPAQPFMRPAADEADLHTPEAAAKAALAVRALT